MCACKHASVRVCDVRVCEGICMSSFVRPSVYLSVRVHVRASKCLIVHVCVNQCMRSCVYMRACMRAYI